MHFFPLPLYLVTKIHLVIWLIFFNLFTNFTDYLFILKVSEKGRDKYLHSAQSQDEHINQGCTVKSQEFHLSLSSGWRGPKHLPLFFYIDRQRARGKPDQPGNELTLRGCDSVVSHRFTPYAIMRATYLLLKSHVHYDRDHTDFFKKVIPEHVLFCFCFALFCFL